MPSPDQRRNRATASRVNDLKSAAKMWNNSYWHQLSWTDVAWGVGKSAGGLAFSVGKAIVMDQLNVTALQALTVDTCAAVGTLGTLVREAVGNFAAYATSDGADKVTTTVVDQMWGTVTDKLGGIAESASSQLGSSRQATAQFKAAAPKWDPVAAMPEIKNLFIDTIVTLAELQAVSTAATGGKLPFNYCDDAHAMWARYYRAGENIDTLKDELTKLERFATEAKRMIDVADSGMNTLDTKLTQLTEAAIDSAQIPHYAGGGVLSAVSRMKQCSNIKCFGPAV